MTVNAFTPIFYLLYGIAFTIEMLAFLMTNMQMLRVLVALSSSCYVVYYYFLPG